MWDEMYGAKEIQRVWLGDRLNNEQQRLVLRAVRADQISSVRGVIQMLAAQLRCVTREIFATARDAMVGQLEPGSECC